MAQTPKVFNMMQTAGNEELPSEIPAYPQGRLAYSAAQNFGVVETRKREIKRQRASGPEKFSTKPTRPSQSLHATACGLGASCGSVSDSTDQSKPIPATDESESEDIKKLYQNLFATKE